MLLVMELTKVQGHRLVRERKRLLDEVAELPLALRASIFERFSTCSRAECACHQGKRHGPRTYLAVTKDNRQRQHYVPKDQCEAARKGVRQYHRLQEIINRVTDINLQLMKGGMFNDNEP